MTGSTQENKPHALTIEEQSALFSAAFTHSLEGMAFVDSELVIRAANESFARQIGTTVDRLVGRNAEAAIPGWVDQFGPGCRKIHDTGNPRQVEAHPFVFPDQPQRGVTYWDATITPVYGPQGAFMGCLLIHLEVTERERARAALREEKEQAERSRQEFLNLMAHELRTPLTTLKGYIQVLMRHGGHDDEEKRLYRVINAQTDRMTHLVQALVDASQIQSDRLTLRRAPLDLCELAEEAVRAIQAIAPQCQTRVTCQAAAVVEGDRERIREVLFHLLDNAVKYSSAGGIVELTVRAENAEATVCVRDHGIGIPKHKQAELFEAFYQVAPMVSPTTGLGLGLFLSREIIRRHGGRIWFESEVGRGSTFCFSLPMPRPSDPR